MSKSERVLVIEDDQAIAEVIEFNLRDLLYDVTVCHDGSQGLRYLLTEKFSLLILDLMLPSMHGLDICRELRNQEKSIPILMLTSLDSETDRVLGLEIGADDYLTKPFSIRELQARVKALLRRTTHNTTLEHNTAPKTIDCGPLNINIERREVLLHGSLLELTAKEFDLLNFMASHAGKVFSRSQLLDEIWGYGHAGYEHTVNTHINRLRNKLSDSQMPLEFIQTVWGVGYKFVIPEETQ